MTETGHTPELHEQPGLASRRGLLIGAGAVAAGIAVTACGGKEPSASGGQSATSEPSSTAAAAPVSVKTTDVPVGGGVVLKEPKVVVTQPQPGQFKAFTAVCTHKQCLVAKVADGTIDCPCHGSRFSDVDGTVVKGPAEQPLAPKTVTTTGDTLTIT
ncbi:Rieske (2Fe-2S) protein [Mycobacterium sp. 852013-50091_SCH5140682]|uniref:QcrA and Rieske domain-containing protein n=1 Tax=Mycobacterium sp. 852013-50091_SCH5140682 TaxID=1834109 RepID=UPI0007EABBEE|nr:Rieske (2Fe-2S) protein [Mycobacterium sp. 852013-50091_SCH5140682]OBC01881.1 Rieske (2Fe-2S) protein [Mycobacterium sp. 852013-50091_SCH5140682]